MSTPASGKTAQQMWDELMSTDFERNDFESGFLADDGSVAKGVKWDSLSDKQFEKLKEIYLERVHGISKFKKQQRVAE